MPIAPIFRESLLNAKRRLTEGRDTIRRQHEGGSPGTLVSAHLTALLDEVVLAIYDAALADFPRETAEAIRANMALVSHSGFGRRDVAPYSDVDLMLLYRSDHAGSVQRLAERLMRDLFDAGLEVGQSVRTVEEACQLACNDATICTSLLESRLLAGDAKLFDAFSERFRSRVHSRRKLLAPAIEQARREERKQFGETVYLLEPNVKRSRGCLRDIQLMRWIGYLRYGEADLDNLHRLGVITQEDQAAIRSASEFLLRLRNELHFFAGKSNDVLNKSEQLRIAKLRGFAGTDGLLPVEQFMSEFFRHAHAVRAVTSNFVAAARPGRRLQQFLGTILSHSVEGDFRVTPREIVATRRGTAKLKTDLVEVLRLADLANLYDKRIAEQTWQTVRTALPHFTGAIDDGVAERFLSLLSQSAQLGDLLSRLHELGVLEKLIPAFAHARSLLQFNEYHKYTVDEHCLRAVKACTGFYSDRALLGRVYRDLKQKRTLHLALLIHDLGKGFPEDHSEVGARIAGEVAHGLRLPLREAETLKFLVHKHLLMSHLAFRRDTSDDQLVVRFAVEVGSPEVLDMLFVLTAADLSAVGPGVWNQWKAEVLGELYTRTMRHLAGDARLGDDADRTTARLAAVRQELGNQADREWFNRQLEALPHAYLFGSSPERIAAELRELHAVPSGSAVAHGRYLPETHTVEFIVGTHEEIAPGVFHRLTGALASQGLQILSAQINTLADGLILDRFYVVDPDFSDAPPQDRIESINQSLVNALRTAAGESPRFRKMWRSQKKSADLAKLAPSVRADNSTSDRFTILDIFATDQLGLLYTISRSLFELGLSVSLAKIGTVLDQVVDVFYVTDQHGNKIHDESRLQEITAKLLAAIESLEET
jgi:[protein-PII] uridylyltransferase